MKSNQVSILVVLVLCLAMGGFLYIMDRSSDEAMGWTPSELYSELGARSYEGSSFSDVTFSGGGNSDGVAVSMRNGSFSLRTRASRASMPVAAPQASSLSLSGSTSTSSSGSLIGHMTSSAEYHSFGGGHSGNMGSAMTGMANSGNVAASFAYSSPSYGVASSGLSSYSPITLSSGTDGTQVMSAEQALISTSNSASGLFGSALQNAYGTATYGDVYGSSANRVNNRFNAPPGAGGGTGGDDEGDGSAYEAWLKWMAQFGYLFGQDKGGGVYDFDNEEAWKAFLIWYEATYNRPYDESNNTTPPEFTYQQWLSWFTSNGGTHTDGTNTFNFIPVGNILPLLLMALVYVLILFVKRNKTVQS